MRKAKKIGILIAVIFIIAAVLGGTYYMQSWPLRFRGEFDQFFGKGNWELISSEAEISRMYKVYYHASDPLYSSERKGTYHNWNIGFTNRDGEKEAWTITDHTLKINHDRRDWFDPMRYSTRQALTLELMDISFSVAAAEVSGDVLEAVLPLAEAECLEVDISYHDGNPPPEFYDQLAREPWFTANEVSVQDYLDTDLYDFYIKIHAHDYRVEKLTPQEQQHLMDSLKTIEQSLKDTYGDDVAYEIYLGEGIRAGSAAAST